MALTHGINISEVPTSVKPPVTVESGIPVVFGTAPINLATAGAGTGGLGVTNVPVLCEQYSDFTEQLGYCSDWENYTLCEAAYAFFQLFGIAPAIFVNVLDPTVHITEVTNQAETLAAGTVTLANEGVILSTLVVKLTSAGSALHLNTDYTAAFNDDGYVVITRIDGGAITSVTSALVVSLTELAPSMVEDTDIIGGVSESGAYTGIQCLEQVFPLFRLVPGQVLAPGWSQIAAVAAVMDAQASSINSCFRAITLDDVPTTGTGAVTQYSDVPAWMNTNNYTSEREVVCWPMVSLSGMIFHMSTQIAALNCLNDSNNNNVPNQSPSNKSLQMDSAVLGNGTPVVFGLVEANYLNGNGVMTCLNWIGGWKAWGNYMACYPADTDPKDCFISVRRMFDWLGNEFVETFWSDVDDPINLVLIQTIVDSENINLNGLAAAGYILGGEMEFLASENTTTDLEAGQITFHCLVTPPTPAQVIDEVLEYDTSYFSALFSSVSS
jgi:phage tail sheath protein FI